MLQNDKIQVPFVDAHVLRTALDEQLNKIYSGNIPIPVPIEEIIENIQKISLEFEEYDEGLLGWSDIASNTIWINSKLLEEENDYRLRFTMAHELGHCVLHKKYKDSFLSYRSDEDNDKANLFYKNNYTRLEIQVNLFAANILMPYSACLKKWEEFTGSSSPYFLKREQERYFAQIRKGIVDLSCITSVEIIQHMSETFQVSWKAAKIQLEQLLLFVNS